MSAGKSGALFCVPYEVQRPNESPEQAGARAGIVLDAMCAHPLWFSSPMEHGAIRESAAWFLTHPEHKKFEVYLSGTLVGMILVSRITPQVDGLLHFSLWGVSLLSARKLLWNFIGGYCFGELGLQRVSFEAPETASTLIKYMRARLAFKYEGELSLEGAPFAVHVVEHLKAPGKAGRWHMLDPEPALARLGSRRESAHWDGSAYRDLLLLRLLKSEFLAHSTPRADSQATEDTPHSEPLSHEPRIEAG